MATEPRNIIEPNWPILSGTVLEGGYQIEDLLEADGPRASFKIRVLGAHATHAHVELFHVEGAAAQAQLEIWQAARELEHPNLSTPLGMGATQFEGAGLIYIILKRPDERLRSVLEERALQADEAREVLASGVRALEQLHAQGYAHGCVSPEQIIAIGDSIQLPVTPVRKINTRPPVDLIAAGYLAPEASNVNITPAADVWCLGATLFEILRQKPYTDKRREEIDALPNPFPAIVKACVEADPQTRCKLAEILPMYKRRGAAAVAASTPMPAQKPAAVRVPLAPRGSKPRTEARPMSSRAWSYAIAAVVIVLLAIWMARPKHTPARAQTTSRTATAQAPPASAWETRTLTPPDASTRRSGAQPAPAEAARAKATPTHTAAAHATPPSVKPQPNTVNGQVWRVVLYTYAREQDARNRAQLVNSKHPGLNADVFSPNGPSGPYLVTAGGRMTREEALRTRQQARGQGMPRDSYIQNYKQ